MGLATPLDFRQLEAFSPGLQWPEAAVGRAACHLVADAIMGGIRGKGIFPVSRKRGESR